MARDENNGEPTKDYRFFYAPATREAFKKASHFARLWELPCLYFAGRRVWFDREYRLSGDRLNTELPLEVRAMFRRA